MKVSRPARASLAAVVGVLVGVLLVTVLVTWAASIGTSGVLTGDGPEAVRDSDRTTSLSPLSPAVRQTNPQDELADKYAGDRPWLRALALVIEIAAVVALLYLLWRGGRAAFETWDARRRPPPEPEDIDFDVLAEPRVLADAIENDAAEQRRLLLSGTPRNGIVECWHRFEVQAAGVGLARRDWETSSEFTLRMLDLVRADSHEVARLAALYREARFSEHPLDEAARAEAVNALDALHAGLIGLGGRR